MGKPARIALFQPLESAAQNINSLFRREDQLVVKQVSQLKKVSEIAEQEGDFDAIVVPSLLLDRASAIHICMQIKSDEKLAATPVIVLSLMKDIPSISTFYGAGADLVMAPPFEPELLFLQISAMSRYRSALIEERVAQNRDLGLRHAMVTTLHLVQEAILILDPNPHIVFANRAARELLKVFDAPDSDEERQVFSAIETLLSDDISRTPFNATPFNRRIIDVPKLKCGQGSVIKAQLQVAPLEIETAGLVAYCVTITDTSLPIELSDTLLQAERVQSLSLLLMAGCGRLLGSTALGQPGSPISKIEDIFISEPSGCALSPIITSLVEVLDLVLGTHSSVKVLLTHDYLVEVKSSDLLQLVGHLVFYALRQSSHDCEVEIAASPLMDRRAVVLSVEASVPVRSATISQERTRTAFRSQSLLKDIDRQRQAPDKLSLGIAIAQKIARDYGSEVKEHYPATGRISLSVELPLR